MPSPYRPEIETAAAARSLDPDLVEAVVEQESDSHFYAYRYEPGFWTKYLASNPTWSKRNPLEVSASIGLMQVMFTTAVEHGFTGQPWELFAPAVALEYGCRVLSANLAWATKAFRGNQGDRSRIIVASALAAYNGGRKGNDPDNIPDRNHEYAESVLRRLARIKARSS
jgi:soluble lytic murein transglycosylase-like protein